MKRASEYLEEAFRKNLINPIYKIKDSKTVILGLIKQAQEEAIEHTLKVAAEKAKMIRRIDKFDDELISVHKIYAYERYYEDGDVSIDKHSILSLKDELFKELE